MIGSYLWKMSVLSLSRSLRKGSATCNIPAIFSKKFSSEVVQTEENVDEVMIGGKKYTNKKVDSDALDKMKLVSRMPTRYRNRMKHVNIPDPDETHPDEYNIMFRKPAFQKMLYMFYGKKSGIDPGFLWPSKEDFKEIKEFEAEWEPSLQSLWQTMNKERDDLKEKMDAREKLIDERMKMMPEYIEAHKKRLAKAKEVEQISIAEKERMMDLARDKFGYKIDPSNPKFQEFQLQVETDEKDEVKAKKKAEQARKKSEYEKSKMLNQI